MNLNKKNSGDWDVLESDTNLVIGNTDSDDGFDYTLFGLEAIVVEAVVGKPIERIKYRRLIGEVLQVKCPLFAPVEYETRVDIPLGIVIVDNPIIIEVPLSRNRKQNVEVNSSLLSLRFASLDLYIPLSIQHSSFIDVEIPLGKTIEDSKRNINEIKNILDSLDDV